MSSTRDLSCATIARQRARTCHGFSPYSAQTGGTRARLGTGSSTRRSWRAGRSLYLRRRCRQSLAFPALGGPGERGRVSARVGNACGGAAAASAPPEPPPTSPGCGCGGERDRASSHQPGGPQRARTEGRRFKGRTRSRMTGAARSRHQASRAAAAAWTARNWPQRRGTVVAIKARGMPARRGRRRGGRLLHGLRVSAPSRHRAFTRLGVLRGHGHGVGIGSARR